MRTSLSPASSAPYVAWIWCGGIAWPGTGDGLVYGAGRVRASASYFSCSRGHADAVINGHLAAQIISATCRLSWILVCCAQDVNASGDLRDRRPNSVPARPAEKPGWILNLKGLAVNGQRRCRERARIESPRQRDTPSSQGQHAVFLGDSPFAICGRDTLFNRTYFGEIRWSSGGKSGSLCRNSFDSIYAQIPPTGRCKA